MGSQTNLFTDRHVTSPGRIQLIDEEFGTSKYYDMYRAEGTVLTEGTPFNADTFNRLFDELANAGQPFADYIAQEHLSNALAVNTEMFTGSIKYGLIGSMVVVYVNVTSTATLFENKTISSEALPAAYRPSTSVLGDWRSISSMERYTVPMLQVNLNGNVQFIVNDSTTGTVPSGRTLKGEVAYFI